MKRAMRALLLVGAMAWVATAPVLEWGNVVTYLERAVAMIIAYMLVLSALSGDPKAGAA